MIDWKFHPHNQSLLATGSDDCTLKIWQIPDGGLTEDIQEAMVTHKGHNKKVGILSWHPSAEHVLATASMDNTVKLWYAIQKHILLFLHLFRNQTGTSRRGSVVS